MRRGRQEAANLFKSSVYGSALFVISIEGQSLNITVLKGYPSWPAAVIYYIFKLIFVPIVSTLRRSTQAEKLLATLPTTILVAALAAAPLAAVPAVDITNVAAVFASAPYVR